MVIVGHVESELVRCEDDQVDADKDGKLGDKFHEFHPDSDVEDRRGVVFLHELTHLAKLYIHAQHASEDGEESGGGEHHREEENPAELHEQLTVFGDEEWRHWRHFGLHLGRLVLDPLLFTRVLSPVLVALLVHLQTQLMCLDSLAKFAEPSAVHDEDHDDRLEHSDGEHETADVLHLHVDEGSP